MNTVFYKPRTSGSVVIEPDYIMKPVDGFPEICISTFSKGIIDRFAAMEQVEIITSLRTANGTNPVYKITYGGREIAFYLSLVGAPACVCGLEEVIALGARKFVFFGCCGVLDDEKVKNNLIVPTAGIRDEGTSYHYMEPGDEIEPAPGTTALLEKCLERCGYSYVTGKIWTTDAIYRETAGAVDEYRKMGCVGVDMEFSALLAASAYRKVDFVQFFYGADNLDSDRWQPRDLTDYGLNSAEKYMALALECGLSLL